MTTTEKINAINAMTDTQVLVAAALAFSKIYGQVPEYWEYVAEIYNIFCDIFCEDQAALKIEEKLGDEYLLDPETCREWLVTEAEYGQE